MSDQVDPQQQPDPMPESFNKARRNLALFSGLLIAWEYVGFVLEPVEGEFVTAKLPGDIRIKIINYEVLPVVIAILVLYFVFRLSIEWNHCHPERRALPAPRADLSVAYVIAAASIALFVLQQILNFRVAVLLTPDAFVAMIWTFVIYRLSIRVLFARIRFFAPRFSSTPTNEVDDRLELTINSNLVLRLLTRLMLPAWLVLYVGNRQDDYVLRVIVAGYIATALTFFTGLFLLVAVSLIPPFESPSIIVDLAIVFASSPTAIPSAVGFVIGLIGCGLWYCFVVKFSNFADRLPSADKP